MRREEAEHEAAWRNVNDERRTRLDFYAFDASAGLADDAWEVTMRLRREPARATTVPVPAPEPEPPPAPGPELPPQPEPPPAEPPRPAPEPPPPTDRRPDPESATSLDSAARRPVRRRDPTGRRRRPRSEPSPGESDAFELEPPPTRLGRLARFVGATVIAIAVLWVGLVITLAVLIHATSVTGVLVYSAGVVVGLAGIGLGILIRRS